MDEKTCNPYVVKCGYNYNRGYFPHGCNYLIEVQVHFDGMGTLSPDSKIPSVLSFCKWGYVCRYQVHEFVSIED